jgi:hypothetical protein
MGHWGGVYGEDDVVEEKHPVKRHVERFQRFQDFVPGTGKVWNHPQLLPASAGHHPPSLVFRGTLGNGVRVRLLAQNDGTLDAHLPQACIQLAQRSLGVVPAARFVQREVDIADAERCDQRDDRVRPVASQDRRRVPVVRSNEDAAGRKIRRQR